jgi:hypothetical protein
MAPEGAGQGPKRPLVQSLKRIEEVTEAEWVQIFEREGITSVDDLVKSALAHAKAHPGQPKPGEDWWALYHNQKWALCGP